MFTVICCMFGGIGFGWLLRKQNCSWIHPGVFHTFHRHFLVHAVGQTEKRFTQKDIFIKV